MIKILFYAAIAFAFYSSFKKNPSVILIAVIFVALYIFSKKKLGFSGNKFGSTVHVMNASQSNNILSATIEIAKLITNAAQTNVIPIQSSRNKFLSSGHKRIYELFFSCDDDVKIIHPEMDVDDNLFGILSNLAKSKNYHDSAILLLRLINVLLDTLFDYIIIKDTDTAEKKLKAIHNLLIKYAKINYFDKFIRIYQNISKKISDFTPSDIKNLIDLYFILKNLDPSLFDTSKISVNGDEYSFESLNRLRLIYKVINPSLSSHSIIKTKTIKVLDNFLSVFQDALTSSVIIEERKIQNELERDNDISGALRKIHALNKQKAELGQKPKKIITEEQYQITKAIKVLIAFFGGIVACIFLQPLELIYSYNQVLPFAVLILFLYITLRNLRGVLK
jgi:hypothetical protein